MSQIPTLTVLGISPSDERVPLTRLAPELGRLTGRPSPTYKRCYMAILDGVIPAEKLGREYSVQRKDLPAIAATLGLIAAA